MQITGIFLTRNPFHTWVVICLCLAALLGPLKNVKAEPDTTCPPGVTGTVIDFDSAEVSGTWASGSTYCISNRMGSTNIPDGATLTIQPGVVITYAWNVANNNPMGGLLTIYGTLNALGSAAQPITWNGVDWPGHVDNAMLNFIDGSGTLDYVNLDAKQYHRNVILIDEYNLGNSNVIIHHSVLKNAYLPGSVGPDLPSHSAEGSAVGIAFEGHLEVYDSSFTGNDMFAVYNGKLTTADDPVLQNLTLSGNGRNAVYYLSAGFNGSQTWENYNVAGTSEYWMEHGPVVNHGATLTVEPGVKMIIELDPDWKNPPGPEVSGTLNAIGTAEHPILMTTSSVVSENQTPIPGDWGGLYVSGMEGAEYFGDAQANLAYVTIEYARYGVYVDFNAVVNATHSNFNDSELDGVNMFRRGTVNMTDCTLNHNGRYLALIQDTYLVIPPLPSRLPVLTRLSGTGNAEGNVVSLWNTYLSGGASTLTRAGIPYRVVGNMRVDQGATLNLTAGVTLQINDNLYLLVNGLLNTNGTGSAPVVITCTTPSAGACQGVQVWGEISTPAYATLTSTTVRYGNPNISLDNGVLNATDSLITDGITGIEVIHHLGGTTGISWSKIMGNTFGVRNQQPSSPFYARNNWWGNASGPYDPLENPGGLGNAVSAGVIYRPFIGPDLRLFLPLLVR